MCRAESGVDDHSRGVVTLEFLGEGVDGVDHLLLTRRANYCILPSVMIVGFQW